MIQEMRTIFVRLLELSSSDLRATKSLIYFAHQLHRTPSGPPTLLGLFELR